MELHPEGFNDVYKEMTDELGSATMVYRIWKSFGGTSITFPKKLYSQDFTRRYIKESIGRQKPSEVARDLRLTERRVRQIIREIREEEG